MDLDVSQDSFAFSDVVPPSHVSDLQSFSDLEFSDSEISLSESSRSPHDSEEEKKNENASTVHSQHGRQSREKGRESFPDGLHGLNDENIKEYLAAIEKTKKELDLASSSRGSFSSHTASLNNLDESSLGILNIDTLQDFIDEDQCLDEQEANNRTLIGEDEEINLNAVDSSEGNVSLQFTAESNKREMANQREHTLEARPDTGQNPDEFFNLTTHDQESRQEMLSRDISLGFSNNSDALNMMLLARSGSGDGGEMVDRASLTSTISFIQSQTFPDSMFSQSLSSRGLGSGMDSGSESDVTVDQSSGQQVSHTSGDGSNGNDLHRQLNRQTSGGDGDIVNHLNQHQTVIRPGLEGGNSEAEDDVTQTTQTQGVGMESVSGCLGLRQSAEGDDVVPDIPGDGGGGGDGSSGSDSEDNNGPAGAAYASSSSSTVPSRTASLGAYSSDFLNQLGMEHGVVGVPPQGDGQHATGSDRQQPVGHGTGDASLLAPGPITNNRPSIGLGNISGRSLGLFEFQAASTPMVRQQHIEAADVTGVATLENSALGLQYLQATNPPHSSSVISGRVAPFWSQNAGSTQFSQEPNQDQSGQNLSLDGVPSLVFEPTTVAQSPRHQDSDKTMVSASISEPKSRSGQQNPFLEGSFLNSVSNEDSKLWKSTPREDELSRLTPGAVFNGDTKPSPVADNQELEKKTTAPNTTSKTLAGIKASDMKSTPFNQWNGWPNATDVSNGFASSGDLSSLLGRLAIEVNPTERTLTPGGTSLQDSVFQNQSYNSFNVTPNQDWQNQEEYSGIGRNPFDTNDQEFGWTRGDEVADFSDFEVQGNAEDILAADEQKFKEEHKFDHMSSMTAADISMGQNWTVPDESQYVMRRSLPVIGVNDPDNKGEVRISFGAFLAARSEELGDLSSKDPNRPRPQFGSNMPVTTPPPHTPFEVYPPASASDLPPFSYTESPPDPSREGLSTQESPNVLSSKRQTPVTVKKQPKAIGRPLVHAQSDKTRHLAGDKDRANKEGRNHASQPHYQGQDHRTFEAYKSSLDEQYKDELRRRRSSRGSSRSSSSSKSSSHASVQSVISNKEKGRNEQGRLPSGDKSQRDKIYRHSEKSHTKRKLSKEDSRKRRNATSGQSDNTDSRTSMEDQRDVSSSLGFDSGLPRTASSSLTSLLSSSTDISTMSQYEVAVLIANAVGADPEEISKMLISAAKAKAKTKVKTRTLSSRQGEGEHQQGEKSQIRNSSSKSGRKLVNGNVSNQTQNLQSHAQTQPAATGSETNSSPLQSHTSPPFKPSSTSSPHFSSSLDGNSQPLSITAFSSPTEIHSRNTQPDLSSYNLTNSSVEASVFSHETSEVDHVTPKIKMSPEIQKGDHTKPSISSPTSLEGEEFVPKFGKTYTIRELPAAHPAVCERKQNRPLDVQLKVQDLQGGGGIEEAPGSNFHNRSLDRQELAPRQEDSHSIKDGNKQILTGYQSDAPYCRKSSNNLVDIEQNKANIAEARHNSRVDLPAQGLQPQVLGNTVSRAYSIEHIYPTPVTQMPNQAFTFQGAPQLYVNTNPSPLGMPLAQQTAFPVNNYPDHVVIAGGQPLPTPVGPVPVPQFPQHLYGTGNLPLGATVQQVPNYNLVGGVPYQHPSVQTVSAGIGTRTSSFVTALSHAANAVSNPPFIQTAPPGLLQTKLQQGEMATARVAPVTSVIVPEGTTFPSVCCAGVSTSSVFPLHNSSGRWMQCEIRVATCSFNGVQVPVSDEGPFIIQPKVIVAPYSTENVKIKFEPRNAGVYTAQIQAIPSPVVPEAQMRMKTIEPSVPCMVSMEIIAEEPKVEILPEDSRVLEFGEMVGGKKQSRPLRLVNHGRASVPVRVIISANASSLHCFSFANADSSPRRSASSPSKSLSSSGAGLCIQTITLTGKTELNTKVEPTVVWLLFQAPTQEKSITAGLVGPPDSYSARVDVEIDSAGQGPTVGSVLLKANVGVVRLHTPHSLQAISLCGAAGQRVSRALPLRNAGNITFQAELKVIRDPEYFNITPDRVMLKPGQETEVHIHFRATKPNIVVDSSLSMMVLPDGPVYEMILRGSCTSEKQPHQESGILMCNKPVVCWGGVGLGRAIQQKVIIRNQSKAPSGILQLQLSIQGNHSDFQIVNSFGNTDEKTTHMVKLPSQDELAVHLLFAPSSMGLISSALVIRTPSIGTKSKVPLYGCGGASNVIIVDAKKPTERADYLADIGEVSLGNTNVTKLTIRNTGTRAAFVKAICYSDIQSRTAYPATHLSIAPNDFILPERSSKQVVIVYQPMEKDALRCRQEVSTVATVAFYTGDENLRAQYKRYIKQQAKPYLEATDAGSLAGINFLTVFQGEDELFEDAVYPQVANWNQFFQSCVTRMLLLLVGLPPQPAKQNNPEPVDEIVMPDIAVPPTPARKLPEDARPSISKAGNTDLWTVIPEHVVLTAPRSGSEKATQRLQLVNFTERALGFEFIWPAHCLVLTPDRGQIPSRSQVMVVMSTKPSLALTGVDLPWGGTVYVQCDGIQKAVRVQIREDMVLDNSPYQPGSEKLQSLSPNTALVTPYNPPLPTRHLPSLRVDPKVVSFDETQTGKTAVSNIALTNNGTAVLKWNMSSVAPAYVKAQDDSGDIFRTTYSVFHIARHSGTVAPGETVKIPARFQPRDAGVYSQHWDIQAKDDDSKQSVKAKVELAGQAVKAIPAKSIQPNDSLSMNQPPSKDTYVEQQATLNTSRKSNKHSPGVYLESDVLEFPDTAVEQTSELRVKLCNNSGESQQVKLIDPKLPFSITHHKLKLSPRRFVRVPVKFTPGKPSQSFKSQLIITTEKGQKLIAQLVGSSVSVSQT